MPDLVVFVTVLKIGLVVLGGTGTYLVAGAIWHAVPSIVLGGLMVVVALVAPFFGYPNHYLFLSIAGGAVFIGGAIAVARFARGGAND